jgi:hypothetical protein
MYEDIKYAQQFGVGDIKANDGSFQSFDNLTSLRHAPPSYS